jgi:hypothetical protein
LEGLLEGGIMRLRRKLRGEGAEQEHGEKNAAKMKKKDRMRGIRNRKLKNRRRRKNKFRIRRRRRSKNTKLKRGKSWT